LVEVGKMPVARHVLRLIPQPFHGVGVPDYTEARAVDESARAALPPPAGDESPPDPR
jgi:hypothetical protein